MAKNLFISSNILVTFISSLIIKKKHQNDYNVLLIVTNYIEEPFINLMCEIAKALGCFNKILCFHDFSKNMHMQYAVQRPDADIFDFDEFEYAAEVLDFNNIYSTLYYYQAETIIKHYKFTNIGFIENGTASYIQEYLGKFNHRRVKELYTLNYYGLFSPIMCKRRKYVKNIVIDKDEIKKLYDEYAKPLNLKEDNNSIILCAHNLSLNKYILTQEEEFQEYNKIINFFIKRGYTVYYKNHPKTSQFLYNKFSQIKNEKLRLFTSILPVEFFAAKIKPKAVVGMFSTALLMTNWLYDIPSYVFKFKTNLRNIHIATMAYCMIMSYFPDITAIDTNDYKINNIPLMENPLFNIVYIDSTKKFVSIKKFNNIKQNIQNCDYENFMYFSIKKELFDIYKNGSWKDLINYYKHDYINNLLRKIYKRKRKPITKKT